jgi:hypothetical protein
LIVSFREGRSAARPGDAGLPQPRTIMPTKRYTLITGILFGLLAIAHLWRTIVEWGGAGTDPWFILIPGIGVIAGALSIWACRLYRRAT